MSAKKSSSSTDNAHFWESLSARNQHLICLGFLFIIPFILFFSSTLGGEQYLGHDAIQWRAGAESITEYNQNHDDIAHWAANMFSGMPATTISHPPQAWNFDTLLKRGFQFMYPAIEYWVLFGGAYTMLLLMGMRPLTAVFGSVVIGLSTYIPIIIGAGHNAKFFAYIYIPWIYVGYFLITRTKINRWLAFFAFALALTLHLRAYHPQVTYFFLFPLGTLFIVDAIRAYKNAALKPFTRQTGLLLMAAVLATLITLQLYWSTAEYSSYSMRGGSEIENTEGLSQNYAFAWSQGVGELLTLVIPGSYGGASGDAYWGPKSVTSGPHYMGALVVLFFIIGVIRSKHKLKWVFLGPGIATLLFSLGENFLLLNQSMFDFFPLFDKFRAPEMWLMTSVFCFGVVSAMGLSWIAGQIKPIQGKSKRGKQPGRWKQALMIAGVAGLIFTGIGFAGLSYEKPGERQQLAQQIAQQNQVPVDDPRVSQTVNRFINNELLPQREEMARADSLRFALFFALGIGLIWFAGGRKIAPATAIGVLCVLLAADMILVDKRYISESSLVDGSLSREDVIESQAREIDRFIQSNSIHDEGWSYRTLPLLDNPFNNAVPAYFYPSVGGYSGAKLGYYQDLIDGAIFSGPSGINTGVLEMLNVKYISARGGVQLPGFETAFRDEQGTVIENMNVLPKAWYVDSVETLVSEPDVLNRISGDFDAGSVAYTSTPLSSSPVADSAATATVTDYGPNRLSLELSRSEPGFLVLGEIWYPPGWSATLNGEETDIIRTNYVLRGFEIPAGDHELVLTLDPEWYTVGNWLGRLGTIALFGTGIFGLILYWRDDSTDDKLPDNEDSDKS